MIRAFSIRLTLHKRKFTITDIDGWTDWRKREA